MSNDNMSKMIGKIYKGVKYLLSLALGLKVFQRVKNILISPVIFDVFVTRKNDSVCVIAPYYSRNAFEKSRCLFTTRDIASSHLVQGRIVDESERGCLMVLYPIPEILKNDNVFSVVIKRGRTVLFSGPLMNIINKHPVYNLSIATLVKYEAGYIREWVEHHLKVGVEHFYIYDNNSDDKSVRNALGSYIDRGLVTYISWPYPYVLYHYSMKPYWPVDSHIYTQIPQIHHAIYKYAHETEWLLSCDVDEYFYSLESVDLKRVISLYKGSVALQVSGYYFGGTDKERVLSREKGVVASFVKSESLPTSSKKLIVNTSRIYTQSIHEVIGSDSISVPTDKLVFNHYRALGWKNRLDPGVAVDIENKRLLNLFEPAHYSVDIDEESKC